ncbi:MAG: Cys-Gln thioester bond-forming surface protein, partial [Bacilli bacterium]|nr:Cys-Gln thioester bond-forming surface protein [Bacilli bacterium]
MKNNKIITMILTLIGILSSSMLSVLDVTAATVPNTVTLKSKSNLYYFTETKGTDYISGYNFYRKELTDGTYVYCVSNINTSVPAGKTLSLKGEITDAGLSYILQNGYPYKSFTGNDKKDYYITQSAIWEYFDETRGSNNWKSTKFTASDTGMKGYVYQLVTAAKSARTSEVASSSVSLIVIDKKMNLSSDGNYYVSSPIRVTTEATSGEATVTLSGAPSGTIVKSASGETKTTYKNGEDFYVYVPASKITESGSLKVKVSSKSTTVRSYEYSSGKSGLQNIGLVVSQDTSVSTSVTLTYEIVVKTKLKISKQDITSKEELPGATLVIKDKTGKVVATWVSTNEPKYIEGLEPGDYTLTETIAPNGYVLSSETISFTLKADGSVKSVVMYNAKEEITKLRISKQDITSKEELPGATLVIKDKTGKVIETWVSTNEPKYIEGLEPGDYTLTETTAPNGYVLSSETISFTLKADGSVKSVVMYNARQGVTRVKI